VICVNNEEHGRAIAQAAGCSFYPGINEVISREEGGRLLGGVIYQDYNDRSISAHIAGFGPNWISPDLLWAMFHYPFVQLGCKKIIGFVPSYNHRALAFDYKLGFKYVTKVPGVFDDGDLIVLVMERDECRWLRLRPRHLEEVAHG
jgi:RimJ/RimL family protein N-acetyltransferase